MGAKELRYLLFKRITSFLNRVLNELTNGYICVKCKLPPQYSLKIKLQH